ncbi:unnamed protein product, partial [Larinioides sclopetarius]
NSLKSVNKKGISLHIHTYTHIYIYRERYAERERERKKILKNMKSLTTLATRSRMPMESNTVMSTRILMAQLEEAMD